MSEGNPVTENAEVFRKIAAVAGAMTRIPQTGRHQTQNYAFATDADVVDAVRAEMAKVKLACIPNLVSWQRELVDINGKTATRTICEYVFTLGCGDTGQMFETHWVGESMEFNGDKGFSKAATAAMKSFFMKIFQVTAGKSDEVGTGQRQQRQQQQPPPSVDSATGEILPPAPQQQQRAGYAPPMNLEFNWNKVIADADKYFKSASEERFNTCQKMKAEGAFAACKTADEAAKLLAARVKKHHEQPEEQPEGLPI